MDFAVHEIGRSKSRVLVIDDFLEGAGHVVEAVAALAPFPPETRTAYPGLRLQVSPEDRISAYVMKTLQKAMPFIRQGFGAAAFSVVEASFSMVTTPPEALAPVQRVPHFDCDDPGVIAILHHLHHLPDTGTAFYRHIETGLECAGTSNAGMLLQHLRAEGARLGTDEGADEFDRLYETLFSVEGRFNRLVMYQGCLLHSGKIAPGFAYSSDPRVGRLTGNIFIRVNEGSGMKTLEGGT